MEMAPAMTPVSLESTPGSGSDEDGGRQLSDALGGEDPGLDRVELRDLLERAMQHLTPRERAIMAMRFYDEMSQSEIAKRLGISQMHVSRLQRAALEQLRQYLPETAT
jgi:RNA polymerase sigma-B factor